MSATRALAIVTILLSAAPLVAGSSASLVLEPSEVVAGTPASLRLTISNDGDADIVVPERLLLRVIPATASAFVAEWGGGQEHRFSNAVLPTDDRRIPAHSTRDFLFPAYALDESAGWFWDPRLNAPGTYRLQVLFVDRYNEDDVFHTRAFDLERTLPVRLVSSESVLKIDVPRGADAAIWTRMLEMAREQGSQMWSPLYRLGRGWREYVNDVVENHPESAYAPFVVGRYSERSATERYSAEERLKKIRRVLDLHPATPAHERIELLLAGVEVQAAQEAESVLHRDVNRATQFYERARADYQNLAKTAADPKIRQLSREWLDRIPTSEDLRRGDGPPDGER